MLWNHFNSSHLYPPIVMMFHPYITEFPNYDFPRWRLWMWATSIEFLSGRHSVVYICPPLNPPFPLMVGQFKEMDLTELHTTGFTEYDMTSVLMLEIRLSTVLVQDHF